MGIGHLFFKTITNIEDGIQTKEKVHQANVPEFIYFFGGSAYYNISNRFRFTVDLALKKIQNDRLDDYVHGDNFDYYSYFSFGFTYCIGHFNRQPAWKKALIAKKYN